jgi:hypothetical protein
MNFIPTLLTPSHERDSKSMYLLFLLDDRCASVSTELKDMHLANVLLSTIQSRYTQN